MRDPSGYIRATPDPKHHDQAMRSPMRTEWMQSQGLEIQGLWSRGDCQKVLLTFLLLPKIEFSTLASITRLKGEGVNSTNAKSDLLYKVKT